MRPKTCRLAYWKANPDDPRIMRNLTLSATITPYVELLKQWVADGCPDDAFFRYEAARNRLIHLGLPSWWDRVQLIKRDEPKGKRQR